MKNLMHRVYKVADQWHSRFTVDQSRGGGRSSPEMGRPIDSGARASPRQCEKEDKAVENLTVTGVMRHGDRVKPVMKGSVGSASSSTGGTTGRRQAKTNEDLSAEGSEMRHQGGTHRPVASAS
jgi:hypothetical protein